MLFFIMNLTSFYFLFFKVQAKPSKWARLNKPVNDSNPSEPEKQQPELSHTTADRIVDDLSPQDQNVDIDPMNANSSATNLPSPIRTTSPVKPAEEKDDDVTITGHGFTTPGRPTTLSRRDAKEELNGKSMSKFDIASYQNLDVNELYSSYLSRLHTGRDLEADIVKRT